MKTIALSLCYVMFAMNSFSAPVPKIDTIDSWEIYVNEKLLITENKRSQLKTIKLEMLSKTAVFGINYNTNTPVPRTKYLEIVNKNGKMLKKYTYEDQSGSEQMSFKVADFFDYLTDDEKLTIYYSEKSGKNAKTVKVKLAEITF